MTSSLLTLNISGTLLAVVFGVIIVYFGLSVGWFFIAVLLDFLILSSIATKTNEGGKLHVRGYEKVRSWKNVIANGIVPVVVVLIYFFFESSVGLQTSTSEMLIYSFVASVASITADKFASEFGVLKAVPIDIITRKKVKKGTSGGVTVFGTAMGACGAFLIGLTVFALGATAYVFIVVVASGVFGNVVDSLLGHFEERGLGNKYTSNFLCSLSGTLVCFAVLSLLPVSLLA
ncbi:MAG: DUF92 domain-containing protein [Candidatus Marsarchaeota archaeon]|nr:DUF92 domain-containing protein [Candidatus Marsarchaeota archaeon]MCL5413300.1 DUF92 domain-containing protein [Candidatus Marsarchaeota archaeon]